MTAYQRGEAIEEEKNAEHTRYQELTMGILELMGVLAA